MASHEATFDAAAWRRFLQDWSDDVVCLLKQQRPECMGELAEESLSRGTLLREPASVVDIECLEQRLGVPLPTSYKRFLLVSNGFPVHGLDAEDGSLRPAEAIGWLRDNEPDLVQAWSRTSSPVADELYFNHGPEQDTIHLRAEYMKSTLQLSDFVDSAVVLLNSVVVDARGEWEAWDFSNAFPGAYRYRSFEELMAGLRSRSTQDLRTAIAFFPMLAARRT